MQQFSTGERIVCAVVVVTLASCGGGPTEDKPPQTTVPAITRVWKASMLGASGFTSNVATVATPTHIYFVGAQGRVMSSSRSDGAVRWTASRLAGIYNRLLIAGDVVVDAGSRTYAYGRDDGVERWQYVSGGPSGCDASSTATQIVICADDGRLVALDAVTGSVRWNVRVADSLAGDVSLVGTVISGDTAYVAARVLETMPGAQSYAAVVALALSDGRSIRVIRERGASGAISLSGCISAPFIAGSTIVLPHQVFNRLTAVNRFTGAVTWRAGGDGIPGGFHRTPTSADGIIYAASADERVYAIDATTGSVRWKSDALGEYLDEVTPCASRLVTWDSERVRVLDRSTGRTLALVDDDMPDASYAISSPPFAIGNELYVRSSREYRMYRCP